MGKKKIPPRPGRRRFPLDVVRPFAEEKTFVVLIAVCVILSAVSIPFPYLAMWLGFTFAAYSAVANDSIQSLGTFIESNRDKKWWVLWIFTGGIFLITVTASWIIYDGDVTWQRLLGENKFKTGETASVPGVGTFTLNKDGTYVLSMSAAETPPGTVIRFRSEQNPQGLNKDSLTINLDLLISKASTSFHQQTDSGNPEQIFKGNVFDFFPEPSGSGASIKSFYVTGSTSYPNPYEMGKNFSFLQLLAPLVLLVLTRLKMPVSTTFLLLSVFSADSKGITSVVSKSVSGYVLAFILSFIIWYSLYNVIKTYFKSRKTAFGWTVAQWLISGSLWAVWLMQDASNIAVFLPRRLDTGEFIAFSGVIFIGLGVLFFLRGDKIQDVVSEKVRISDVRAATLVDFTYVLLMIYKLFISTIPMSTTWVFLGVIGGREVAVSLSRKKEGNKHKIKALKMIGKDVLMASIGLIVSVILAIGVNDDIRNALLKSIADIFK